MRRKNILTKWIAFSLALVLGGCARGPEPAISTPAANTGDDKAVDSVAGTYRVTEEEHSLIEAKRVEKDTGIVEEALEE